MNDPISVIRARWLWRAALNPRISLKQAIDFIIQI